MTNVTVRFSEAEVERILDAVPWARLTGDDAAVQARSAIDGLVSQEAIRRSGRDGLTGAWTRGHLLTGELFNQELRAASPRPGVAIPGKPRGFGHPVAFRTFAIVVDVHHLATINDRFGFAVGDSLLQAVARALFSRLAESKVVRIHGDAFAALFSGARGEELTSTHRSEVLASLSDAVEAIDVPDFRRHPVRFSVALLDLTVVSPFDGTSLGSVIAAELERAMCIRMRDGNEEVQVRRVDLDGYMEGRDDYNSGRW